MNGKIKRGLIINSLEEYPDVNAKDKRDVIRTRDGKSYHIKIINEMGRVGYKAKNIERSVNLLSNFNDKKPRLIEVYFE